MNTAVMDGLRITLTAMAGILLFKLVFQLIKVPGLSDIVAAV